MKQKIDEIEDKFCYYIRWRTCTKLIKKIQEEKSEKSLKMNEIYAKDEEKIEWIKKILNKWYGK